MNIIDKLKANFGDLGALDRELRGKIEKCRLKIESLRAAPLTKADYKAKLAGSVDLLAAEYTQGFKFQVDGDFNRNPLDLAQPDKFFRIFAPNQPDGHGKVTPAALAYFFPDLIKAGLSRAVDEITWPTAEKDCGPAVADRQRQLTKLEAELADLVRQRAELRESARAAAEVFSEKDQAEMDKRELSAKHERERQEAARLKELESKTKPYLNPPRPAAERRPGEASTN